MDLPSHATILVHLLSPLDVTHAEEHISKIKAHGSSDTLLEDATRHPHAWQIKNKYYTADVGFKIVDLSVEEGGSAGDEPAIIVLAPRHANPSPDLKPLLARLVARSNEFEIALLVTYPHSSGDSELDEDAWKDLAIEHGFEWVDGKESDVVEDEEDGEKGIARVVGALHAHMWEGMVRETLEGRGEKKVQPVGVNKEVEGDHRGLGAPPLPEPRPFIPTPLAFPTTFLPSIARSSTASGSNFSTLPPATIPTPPPTSSDLAPLATFDDDFAPFVPTLPTTSFPPLLPPSPPPPEPSTLTALYRHPELAFPDTEDLLLGGQLEEGEEEDLLELVERLRGLRETAKGLGVEERREMAERVVAGLLGE